MKLAGHAVDHAGGGGCVGVAVDDGEHPAPVFGLGPVGRVDDEVLAGGTGDIAARHVFAPFGAADEQPAGFARVLAFGMLADGGTQVLVDDHGYLELCSRLEARAPPKRAVLRRSLQARQSPRQRSRAGLSVDSLRLVKSAVPR